MENVYYCGICKKEFSGNTEYGGRIPQSEFLKPGSDLKLSFINIRRLPKRCYSCDDKLFTKVNKILSKKRKQDRSMPFIRDLSKKAYNDEMNSSKYGDNPFKPDYVEWLKLQRKEWKYQCTCCDSVFNQSRTIFKRKAFLQTGSITQIIVNDVCVKCIDEMVIELKDLKIK